MRRVSDVLALLERAQALLTQQRFDEAEASLRSALKGDPTLATAHQALAPLLQQRGALNEARSHFEQALRHAPDSLPARVGLAEVLIAQREFTEGARLLRAVAEQGAGSGALRIRIGAALEAAGEHAQALAVLESVVALDPTWPEAHYHLADAALRAGQFEAAARHAAEAVRRGAVGEAARQVRAAALAAAGDLQTALFVLRAADAPPRPVRDYLRTLGQRLARAGAHQAAQGCFERMLQERPDDAEAAHLAAAAAGANPARPDPAYVRQHFDRFADSFEAQLARIGYAAPRELTHALGAVPTRSPPWQVLDLGCGTGLVAAELGGRSARIDGIDLSPLMIEHARRKGRYHTLRCAELLHALTDTPAASYDVVTAADVFIYVGQLDAVIAAIRRVLRPGGMLAFSAEADEQAPEPRGGLTPGYWLQVTGRYAHSAAYLEYLSTHNGFEVRVHRSFALRMEWAQSVGAWLELWSLPT